MVKARKGASQVNEPLRNSVTSEGGNGRSVGLDEMCDFDFLENMIQFTDQTFDACTPLQEISRAEAIKETEHLTTNNHTGSEHAEIQALDFHDRTLPSNESREKLEFSLNNFHGDNDFHDDIDPTLSPLQSKKKSRKRERRQNSNKDQGRGTALRNSTGG